MARSKAKLSHTSMRTLADMEPPEAADCSVELTSTADW
jgi:hypothetical protein